MPTATKLDEEKVSSISSIRHAGQPDVNFTCLGRLFVEAGDGMRGSPQGRRRF